MISIERYHDISMGHRVYGHESKCSHLHGHNYRFYFTVEPIAELDDIGRVIDFSVIKSELCEWLENNWDHKFLIFQDDPIRWGLTAYDPEGVVIVGFNPTAENIAMHMVNIIGPMVLEGLYDVKLISCRVEETRKCSATYTLDKEISHTCPESAAYAPTPLTGSITESVDDLPF